MNKKLLIGTVVVMIAVIAAIIKINVGDDPTNVAAKSSILCGGGNVYYNDVKGNLLSVPEEGGEAKIVAQGSKLMSAEGDLVLVDTEDGLKIIDKDGKDIFLLEGEHYDCARLFEDKIYYKNDDGTLWRMNQDGTERYQILESQMKNFIMYERNVIYTSDGTSLIVFSIDQDRSATALNSTDIDVFSADDGFLFLPNPNNGYTLMKIVDGGSSVEELLDVRSKNFAYKNGILHYIENAKSKRKSYKLMHKNITVGA